MKKLERKMNEWLAELADKRDPVHKLIDKLQNQSSLLTTKQELETARAAQVELQEWRTRGQEILEAEEARMRNEIELSWQLGKLEQVVIRNGVNHSPLGDIGPPYCARTNF